MQDIIDRINKLLALATSANEYEASAAAAKAQEILTEHNLRLEDIETGQKSPPLPIEQITISSNSRKVYWRGFIANVIAHESRCGVLQYEDFLERPRVLHYTKQMADYVLMLDDDQTD